jgi:hypothetical protein
VGARSRVWDERFAVKCVCVCVCAFFVLEVGSVALVEETNCENKAEWRRGSGARALSIAELTGALSHGD